MNPKIVSVTGPDGSRRWVIEWTVIHCYYLGMDFWGEYTWKPLKDAWKWRFHWQARNVLAAWEAEQVGSGGWVRDAD